MRTTRIPQVLLGLLALLGGVGSVLARDVSVRLTRAVPSVTGRSYQVLGRVESSDRAQLVAPFDGIVTRVAARPGTGVKAGALLLELRPLTLGARTQAARVAIKAARTNLAQKRILVRAKLITAGQLDAAQAELALAQAQLGTYQAELGLGRVQAPFAGTVRRVVPLGSRVIRGQTLLRIRGSRGLRIEADYPLAEAQQLKPGTPARIWGQGRAGVAEVYAVAQSADRFGLVAVYLTVPPALTLMPGEVVQVRVAAKPVAGAWLVPQSAVVMRGQKARVFVYQGGQARSVAVRVHAVSAQGVVVTGPLDASSVLVASNVAWLRPGTPLRARSTGTKP